MTASALASALLDAPCIVDFLKKDGSLRRMITVPQPGGVLVKQGYVTAYDAENEGWRRIKPEAVQSLRPLVPLA